MDKINACIRLLFFFTVLTIYFHSDPQYSRECWGGRTWAQTLRQVEWRRWCGRSRSETDAHTGETWHPPALPIYSFHLDGEMLHFRRRNILYKGTFIPQTNQAMVKVAMQGEKRISLKKSSLIVPSCSVKREVTQFCNVSLHNMVSDKVENSRPVFSNRTLSLRPKRNSGIPERKTRILIEPTISLRRTLPLALTWNTKSREDSLQATANTTSWDN